MDQQIFWQQNKVKISLVVAIVKATAVSIVSLAVLRVTDATALIIAGPLAGAILLVSPLKRWTQRRDVAVTMSDTGLTVPSAMSGLIPWRAVSHLTVRKPSIFRSSLIVLSLDPIRDAISGRARTRAKLIALRTDLLAIPEDELANALRQRLNHDREVRSLPAIGASAHYKVERLLWPAALCLMLVGRYAEFTDRKVQHEAFRATSIQNYPLDEPTRKARARADIAAHPRDIRVRIAYATVLEDEGRLREAEAQLRGALQDRQALDAIDTANHPEATVEIILARILAEEGKAAEAHGLAANSCPSARDIDMPRLIKLKLCHYS